jgi:hypothetical protein
MRVSYLRILAAAASVAAAAGLLAACTSPHPQTPSLGTSSPSALSATPAPTAGLLPAPPELTDRIVLERTDVTAGTPIKGTLVVMNRGHSPINLNRGCGPKYVVVLTNHWFPPAVGFSADCRTAPFIIAPGETRLAVTVLTTYQSCTTARQATSRTPACLHGNQPMPPPLPPGRYEAVLVGSGLPLPAPAPVPVSLNRTPAS